MPLLEDGQSVRDTYEVERFLGEGAFAEVYRVKHRFLGRQAMKVFKQTGMDVADVEGALGEALLLSKLGHPNIVRVFDANVLDLPQGVHGYFTMEYVSGGTLDKFWRSHGMGLEPARVVEVIKQVCRGLAVAHQESPPIIHRDIKPQNILVGYESGGLRARVSDFGLARHVNPLTLLATAAGTLAFKPPEAFLLERADSRAGDVWALGVTLYLLLTDRLPVEEPAQGNWLRHEWKRKPVIPPSELSPLADTVLDRIILKALEFDPAKRFESAGEMLEALDGWQEPADRNTGTTMREETRKTDTRDAETMAEEALAMQRQGILEEAASLMEEAINRSPSLRQKHEHRVALWRRGISM